MGFKIATVTRSSGPTVLRAVLALAVAAAALGGLALGDPSSSSDRGRGGNALPRHAREAGGTTTRDELAGWSRDELIRRIVHLETQTSAALSTTRAGASVPQRARREASPHVPQETSPGKGWLVFNGCTMSCGGWGDRLRGITQSYLAARLSGRRFAIQATFPVPLTTWIVPHPALEHPCVLLATLAPHCPTLRRRGRVFLKTHTRPLAAAALPLLCVCRPGMQTCALGMCVTTWHASDVAL